MKKLLSLLILVWWSFFLFNRDALCQQNDLIQVDLEEEIQIPKFTDNEILGLGLLDPPEEQVFELLPGEVFAMPEEQLDEELPDTSYSREESL